MLPLRSIARRAFAHALVAAAGCASLSGLDELTFDRDSGEGGGPTSGSAAAAESGASNGAGGAGAAGGAGTAVSGAAGATSLSAVSSSAGGGCAPGETMPCYEGPDGTLGLGTCAAGLAVCDDTGTWGPCTDQKLPAPDDCATPADEDCDGVALPCTGATVWAEALGSSPDVQQAHCVALDGAGNPVVAGLFAGTIALPGGPVLTEANAGTDLFVAAFASATGQSVSAVTLAVNGAFEPFGLAVASKGRAAFGVVPSLGAVDPVGKARLWALEPPAEKLAAEIALSGINAGLLDWPTVAIDAEGSVYLAGTCVGASSALKLDCAKHALFVAKLDGATLAPTWALRIAESGTAARLAVSYDGSAIALAVFFAETIDLGLIGGPVVGSHGLSDVLLVRLDGQGSFQWAKSMGGPDYDVAAALAFDAAGGVALGGIFYDHLAVDDETLGAPSTEAQGFVARFDGAGALVFARSIGGIASDHVRAVAFDPFGHLVVAGPTQNAAELGGAEPLPGGFVAKYHASGAPLWTRGYAGVELGPILAVAVDGSGHVFLTGSYTNNVKLGEKLLLAPPKDTNAFVAKLSP